MKTLTAEKAKELIEHLENCTSINEGWYLQAMRIAYNVLKETSVDGDKDKE